MKIAEKIRKRTKYLLSLFLVAAVIIYSSVAASASSIKPSYKCYVMGPLGKVTDWSSFSNQLTALKDNGVYGITTDVWWGYVEPNKEGTFDWSYYTKYAKAVRTSGLKWVPIMSMHQCGANVGDTDYIPLPSWVWSKDSADNMEFKDENGVWDKEALSPWYSGTAKLYRELYSSFASNFSSYKDIISRIEISAGPSGELRYPSYNADAGWTYPGRGYLECYSKAAITSFQNAMKTKYKTVSALNNAWETSLSNFSQISTPTDHDAFFKGGYSSAYGKDFLTWYQDSLTNKLSIIASAAHSCFDTVFDVDIGAKVSGVHWLYNSPTMPHAAEYCAGYYDYSTLLDKFKSSNLDLTFTCLEMDDDGSSPNYSMPQTLVEKVASLASDKGINISGENALAISNNPHAYQNCAKMLFNYNFSSFTLLRINNVVGSNGNTTSEMRPFTSALAVTPVPVKFTVSGANTYYGQNVYLTGSRWEIGNWTTGPYAFPLSYSNGNWTGTIYLAQGTAYQFKTIKKDNSNVIWESGDNHSYAVPTGGGTDTYAWAS